MIIRKKKVRTNTTLDEDESIDVRRKRRMQ